MNKELVMAFMEKGFLLSPDIANAFDEKNSADLLLLLKKDEDMGKKLSVINKDLFNVMSKLKENDS